MMENVIINQCSRFLPQEMVNIHTVSTGASDCPSSPVTLTSLGDEPLPRLYAREETIIFMENQDI